MPYEYRDFSCNFDTNGFKGSKQLTTEGHDILK